MTYFRYVRHHDVERYAALGWREVDDLTKIRGIGSKVENSLNDLGVYQFRQIAVWTKGNAEEFSRRLEHFAGRMFREKWSEQARQLHLEKYGTEI